MYRPSAELSRPRVLGLDVARALAILMVLVAHTPFFWFSMGLLTPELSAVCTVPGVLGVELFFALSGFLIGDLLLRDAAAPTWRGIGVFFLRRWLRTLPAYYAVLLVLCVAEAVVGGTWRSHGAYWIFLQNYETPPAGFFPVSWTLSIEQWSYAAAPAVVSLLPALAGRERRGRAVLLAVAALLLLFLALRTGMTMMFSPAWDDGLRKQIHVRLDAVFWGVAVACCRRFLPRLYAALGSAPCFLAVLLGTALYTRDLYATLAAGGMDASFFHRALGFSVCDALMALSLPFFAGHAAVNARLAALRRGADFFTRCSRYSYALYLIHFPVFQTFSGFVSGAGLEQAWSRGALGGLAGICAVAASWGVAALLYGCVEKPALDLRAVLSEVRRRRAEAAPASPVTAPRQG